MFIEVTTGISVDEAGKALEEAAGKRKFTVDYVHGYCDELLSKKDLFERELRVYEVCHPFTCRKILHTNIKISTLLPNKICIFKEGSDTVIVAVKPEVFLSIFKEPTLGNLFKEFAEVIEEIINEAALGGVKT